MLLGIRKGWCLRLEKCRCTVIVIQRQCQKVISFLRRRNAQKIELGLRKIRKETFERWAWSTFEWNLDNWPTDVNYEKSVFAGILRSCLFRDFLFSQILGKGLISSIFEWNAGNWPNDVNCQKAVCSAPLEMWAIPEPCPEIFIDFYQARGLSKS
jgi:hypothetical protein